MAEKYICPKAMDYEVDGNPQKNIWSRAKAIILKDSVTGEDIPESFAQAKMAWSPMGLYLLYEVKDRHIWGTYQNDDDPLYDEEVVEVFLAPGQEVPKKYFEFQFSPNHVKFDAKIYNPTGDREDPGFIVDVGWNCQGLKYAQTFDIASENNEFKVGTWWTEAFIPWQSMEIGDIFLGTILRANLFRIDGYPKQNSFQAWQPTLKDPPDFHVPEKFGFIELGYGRVLEPI